MLVGKAIYSHVHKLAHMICELSPYGCMPNTMSVGAMSNVLGQHPDLLYAPIEVKGDAEVHALSRCQMVLTEAKRRAQEEMAEAEARAGLSLEAARRRARQARPELRRATHLVPHAGCAGTAANTLLSWPRDDLRRRHRKHHLQVRRGLPRARLRAPHPPGREAARAADRARARSRADVRDAIASSSPAPERVGRPGWSAQRRFRKWSRWRPPSSACTPRSDSSARSAART